MDASGDNGLVVDLDYEDKAPDPFTGRSRPSSSTSSRGTTRTEKVLDEQMSIDAVAHGVGG